jgi:uncharacterized protein
LSFSLTNPLRPMLEDPRGFAFDRAVGNYDLDGRLRVPSSTISAAQVNDYLAEEIPGWSSLGLVSGRRYALLRDPGELEAAAPSFQGIPILSQHAPITAEVHKRELVVGAVINPVWQAPNLKAELIVWDGDAIAAIESGAQKDLSAGYRYTPIMESGRYQGVAFDGRMTRISANHLALVFDGRVRGAVIGDSAAALIRHRRPDPHSGYGSLWW